MEWNNSLSFVSMKKSLYRICTYKVVLLKHFCALAIFISNNMIWSGETNKEISKSHKSKNTECFWSVNYTL